MDAILPKDSFETKTPFPLSKNIPTSLSYWYDKQFLGVIFSRGGWELNTEIRMFHIYFDGNYFDYIYLNGLHTFLDLNLWFNYLF